MKYKYLLFFCIVIILSISAVSAADNTSENIQTVDSTGDLTDLQNLINEANDTVTLKKNYVGDFNNKTIVINKNITINGNGFYIDYLSNRHIFDIQSSNVTLNNLKVIRHHTTNGSSDVYIGNPVKSVISIIDKKDMPTVIGNDITKIYKMIHSIMQHFLI